MFDRLARVFGEPGSARSHFFQLLHSDTGDWPLTEILAKDGQYVSQIATKIQSGHPCASLRFDEVGHFALRKTNCLPLWRSSKVF
jgi:hypothetical protein